jgi:UMF1 family MFS transporter
MEHQSSYPGSSLPPDGEQGNQGSAIWKDKKVLSWALYDWANSAYAVTVMAGFFPLFFKKYWAAGMATGESTLQLGIANSVASLTVVALAPVLGAIADRGGVRKRFLLFFTLMGVVMTGGLYLVEQGEWLMAVVLYVMATIGFSGGVTFSDSLLVHVVPADKSDFVSGLGYGLGYLGGGILFALCVAMTTWPLAFGLLDSTSAVRLSFVLVSVWWLLFTIPVMLFVREPAVEKVSGRGAVGAGFRQLAATFREIRHLRIVFLFLLGYWLYIDGVDTIVRMAIDYGMALGFDSGHLIAALLLTQFIGFPAAIGFGMLGERIGAKKGILMAIAVYLVVVVWAATMDTVWEFYGLAITIGLVQGGIQSLSRSLYARIIPKSKSAEFFGFYNMLGKFAAVIGPVMVGWVSVLSGNPRVSMLSITVLFILGALLLWRVDEEEGRKMAAVLERV